MTEFGPRVTQDEAALRAAAAAFGLGPVISARDIGGTYSLNVLLETASGAYVVRFHRNWVTPARLACLQETRRNLAAAGLPAVPPLQTLSGESMLELGGHLAEAEPYVPHDAIANSWERYAAAFGLLGRLHDALPSAVPAPLVPPLVSNYGTPGQLLDWLAHSEDVLQALNAPPEALRACEESRALLEECEVWWTAHAEALPFQPIHGDYGGGNVLFAAGQIAALLDFDFLGTRERVYELAYTVYWLLWLLEHDTAAEAYPWADVAELLAIYNRSTRHPFSELEWEAFPLELARVPLYWIAEAGFTADPVRAVMGLIDRIPRARWVLEHAEEVTDALSG